MAQCKAKSKHSGEQCRRAAIPGGAVCCLHGGKAPQVKRAAELRLAAYVDPSLEVIGKSLKNFKRRPDLALSAAKDMLDRNGLKAPEKIELKTEIQAIEMRLEAGRKRLGGLAAATAVVELPVQ